MAEETTVADSTPLKKCPHCSELPDLWEPSWGRCRLAHKCKGALNVYEWRDDREKAIEGWNMRYGTDEMGCRD